MSDGVDIPITVPGADLAKLALEQIVGAFSSLEQKVIALAAKSDQSGKAFADLKQKFIDGKVSADEFRAALERIAAQAPVSAEAAKRAADEKAKAFREAAAASKKAADDEINALEQIHKKQQEAAADAERGVFGSLAQASASRHTEAVGRATRAMEEFAAQGNNAGRATIFERISGAAFAFNNVYTAASQLSRAVSGLAHESADLASEQARLDRVSSSLGLNFNAAADAAGKYTDATTSMTSAARLAEAGVALTQEQLNSLMRVAGNYSATTGRDLNASIEQLTDALLNGEQEGLRRFGPALAAMGGSAHTAQDRLAALVTVARTVPQATDDAADSLRRFEGNLHSAARELSTGFLEELQRLERESNRAAGIVGDDSDSITNHWREVGETGAAVFHRIASAVNLVAEAMSHTVYTAGRLLTAISEIRAHPLSIGDIIGRFDADVQASSARLVGAARALVGGGGGEGGREGTGPLAGVAGVAGAGPRRFGGGREEESGEGARQTFSADEGAQTLKANISRRMGGGHADEHAKSAKAAQMAMDQQDRERRTAQMRVDREFYADLVRQAREYENAIHGAAVQWGEQATHADEVARITAHVAGLAGEQANAEIRLQRARMAQQRAEGSVAARAETADLRDPAAARERIEEMRQQRALQRERSHLERRYQMQRTYTERMEELHGQEFDSTQALAEGVTSAFGGMADAFGKHLQAFVTGKETIGDALQGMLSDTLASIAQQATVKGALELAEGISALAGIVTAPLAPGHFAAAGAYFGVAALAGVGAAAVAPSSPSVAAPASAPREPAARLSKGGAASEGGGTVYNVTFGGPMYGTGGVRQAARQMVGAINRGAVQGGVQLLPGVLMGGGAGS